jgi:quinol monooxygenase YgiN
MCTAHGMIELRVTMRARPGKKQEILQTLEALAPAVRTHWGCLDVAFQNEDGGADLMLWGTWSDRAALAAYLVSREHRALLGAIRVLCESHSTHIGGGRG